MIGVWGGIGWVISFKGREGMTSYSHDAYMSIDESTVKRRGQGVQSHLGQGLAMAPVTNDRTSYQALVGSLHGNDVAARPRSQI